MWFLRFSLSVICIAIVVAAGFASRSFKVLCDTICIRRLRLRRIYCRGCMDLCILLSLNNWNLISKQTIWEILNSNGWRWAAAVSEQGDEPPVVIRTFRCLWVRPLVCELAAFHSYPVTNQPYRLSKDKLGQVLSSFQLPGLDHVPSYNTWWQVHSWFWSSIVITPTSMGVKKWSPNQPPYLPAIKHG